MSMTIRGLQTGAGKFFWLVLIGVILVAINMIAARSPSRVDLTADQRFTLAEPSIAVAEALDAPVRIELFFSQELPAQFEQMRRDVTDLLADYAQYSNGNISYIFIDPDASEDDKTRATEYGVPEWPLQVSSESELSVRRASTGVVFFYDDEEGDEHTVTVDRMLPGANYEYELTRALRDVTTPEDAPKTRLGILVGDGGFLDNFLAVPPGPQAPDPEEIKAQISEQLGLFFEELYDFELVDISSEEGIPEDVAGLFVIGSTAEFDHDMLFRLDQFIMAGNPVAFFVSPYKMQTQQFDQPGFPPIQLPARNNTGLDELLQAYGVRMNLDAVVEMNLMSAQVSVEQWMINMGGQQRPIWVPAPDPRLPVMSTLSRTSLLVPQMPMVAFLPLDRQRPLSQSSLSLTADAIVARDGETLQIDEVMATSQSSYRFPSDEDEPPITTQKDSMTELLEGYAENPDNPVWGEEAGDLEQGPFVIAYSLVGHLDSAFPEDADTGSTEAGRVFIVANGHWIQSLLANQSDPLLNPQSMRMMDPGAVQQVQQYLRSSEMLFRNTADWLAQDSALVRIRAREEPAYIDSDRLTESEKNQYKFFNIAGLPLVFSFLGLCGFLIRQFRRGRLEAQYSQPSKS